MDQSFSGKSHFQTDFLYINVRTKYYIALRVLPTAEFLNTTKKYEIKAHLRGRSFLSVPRRVKRTSVPG